MADPFDNSLDARLRDVAVPPDLSKRIKASLAPSDDDLDAWLRRVPVLFETAISREQSDEFRKRGIRHVLQKPFDLNQLIADVKQLAPPPAR